MFLQGEAERRWQTARCSVPCADTARRVCSLCSAWDEDKSRMPGWRTAGSGCAPCQMSKGGQGLNVATAAEELPLLHPWQGFRRSPHSGRPLCTTRPNLSGRKCTQKQSILRGEASTDQQIWGNCWLRAGPWGTSCCRRAAIPCVGRSTRRWYLPLAQDLFSYGKIIFARRPCHSFTSCGKPGD